MKALTCCIALSVLGSPCFASKKISLVVTAKAFRVIPHESGFNIPVYGSVDTNCYGSGPAWNYSIDCSSYVYPPGDIPVTFSWATVYNEVESNGISYTLKCLARRRMSSCQPLVPGGRFNAEAGRDYLWIYEHVGDSKDTRRVKLYIADEVCTATGKHLAESVPATTFWKYKAPKLPEPGSTSVCPN